MLRGRMTSISHDRIARMLTSSARPGLLAALAATGEDGIDQIVRNANATMQSRNNHPGVPSLHDHSTYSYSASIGTAWGTRITGEVIWSYDEAAGVKLHVLDGGLRGTSYHYYTDGIRKAIARFRQVGLQRVVMPRGPRL